MSGTELPSSANSNHKAPAARSRLKYSHPVWALMLAVITSLLLTALPSSASADQDPLVEMNRNIHGFNRAMDTAILRPIAQTYTSVTPAFVKQRVNSFFTNIDDVRVTINDLLQLKFKQAAGDAGRLLINTTVGIGGLFEVAEPLFGLEKHHEDFGQTLGYWAVDPGPYVQLPFLGPSTLRDSAGVIVDTLLNPIQLLQSSQSVSLAAGDSVNDRAALLEVEGLISGDDYVFIREVYLQHRESLVRDGQIEDTFSDFDSGFDEEFEEAGIDQAGFDVRLEVASE